MQGFTKWITKETGGEATKLRFVDTHRGVDIYEVTKADGSDRWYEVNVEELAGNSYASIGQAKEHMDETFPQENESSLPTVCYTINRAQKEMVILLKRGVKGYFSAWGGQLYGQEVADELNAIIGVTKAQEAAMEAGSLFGFDTPLANPSMYDEGGKLKGGRVQ